jgi:PAS domain S-box-containing protein
MLIEKIEKEQIFDFVLEKLNTLIVVINKNGELIYVSPSVTNVLGYQPNELQGFNWWKETRKSEKEGLEMFYAFKKLVFENKLNEFSNERILIDKSGNKKWIAWDTSFDEKGNLISIGHDVSKSKKKEKQLKNSNSLLKLKQKETIESLTYAQSIQNSILPNRDFLKEKFSNGFVFYQAKDFVSGDFYWKYEFENHYFVACIDCTGHGVPGALMTILANSLLKNVIKHQKLKNPAEILHALDEMLYEEFNKNNQIQRADGMDISLCVFDLEKNIMNFSAANQTLFYVDATSEVHEFKGNRYSIGLYHDVVKKFENTSFLLNKGDKILLSTDGFLDQFGGPKFKRFTRKRFYELIKNKNSLNEIQYALEVEFIDWKGINEQTDDVLVMGIEV